MFRGGESQKRMKSLSLKFLQLVDSTKASSTGLRARWPREFLLVQSTPEGTTWGALRSMRCSFCCLFVQQFALRLISMLSKWKTEMNSWIWIALLSKQTKLGKQFAYGEFRMLQLTDNRGEIVASCVGSRHLNHLSSRVAIFIADERHDETFENLRALVSRHGICL